MTTTEAAAISDDEQPRCVRCGGPDAPFYQDGLGDNIVFNGQPICDDCAEEIDGLPERWTAL